MDQSDGKKVSRHCSTYFAEDIPAGSHKVYVYLDGQYGDPYDTVCIFQPFQDGALVSGASGVINRRVIHQWVRYARKYGYTKVYFARPSGCEFKNFAKFAFELDGMRYYRVDVR